MDTDLAQKLCAECGLPQARIDFAFGGPVSTDVLQTFARAINPHMVAAALRQLEDEQKAHVD